MVEIGLVQACTNNNQVVLEVHGNELPIEPRSMNDAIEAIAVNVLLCAEAPKLFVVEAILLVARSNFPIQQAIIN